MLRRIEIRVSGTVAQQAENPRRWRANVHAEIDQPELKHDGEAHAPSSAGAARRAIEEAVTGIMRQLRDTAQHDHGTRPNTT